MKIRLTLLALASIILIVQSGCDRRQREQAPDTTSGPATASSPDPFAIPGRPDNLSQANLDLLLANGEMNFDGFRFDKKRFDFVNFDKGSFRGTTFYDAILSEAAARRKEPRPERFDFEDAHVYLSKLKKLNFSYWKFLRTTFVGDSITDGSFKYCSFTENKFHTVEFVKFKFNNGLRSPFINGEFLSCRVNGGGFDSISFVGTAFGANTKFASANFNDVEFNSVRFITSAPKGVVFSDACRFNNVKFTKATIDNAVFGDGTGAMTFENVKFDNSTWRNGSGLISFNRGSTFSGQLTVLQNINFTTSVMNDVTFGVKNANYKILIKQCRFNDCQFIGNAVFYNCNLEGSTFPPIADLQAAGVKFIDCLNAPYSSK